MAPSFAAAIAVPRLQPPRHHLNFPIEGAKGWATEAGRSHLIVDCTRSLKDDSPERHCHSRLGPQSHGTRQRANLKVVGMRPNSRTLQHCNRVIEKTIMPCMPDYPDKKVQLQYCSLRIEITLSMSRNSREGEVTVEPESPGGRIHPYTSRLHLRLRERERTRLKVSLAKHYLLDLAHDRRDPQRRNLDLLGRVSLSESPVHVPIVHALRAYACIFPVRRTDYIAIASERPNSALH
jgi:hypothetical protein